MTDDHFDVVRLHSQCDRGMAGMAYPDGRGVLDQPLVLLDAFAIIGDQLSKIRKKPENA